METKDIINGSRLIAEYMGYKYIPFNDLQGLPKAGYWKIIPKVTDVQETKVTHIENGEVVKIDNLKIDLNKLRYGTNKNGWITVGDSYCKYLCRKHEDLRYWNSFDVLIPVIEKIEKETGRNFYLGDGGCCSGHGFGENVIDDISSYEINLTWLQNTFNTVVKTLRNK